MNTRSIEFTHYKESNEYFGGYSSSVLMRVVSNDKKKKLIQILVYFSKINKKQKTFSILL